MMQRQFTYLFLTLFIFWVYPANKLSAQKTEKDSLKEEIQHLYKTRDIIKINKIINKNDFTEPNYALTILNKNLDISNNAKNKNWLADTHLSLGIFWAKKSNGAKAYNHFLEAEHFAKEAGNKKKQGMAILNQANIVPKLDTKISKFRESICLLKSQNDSTNLARSYLNLGYVFFQKYENNTSKDSLQYYENQSNQNYNTASPLIKRLKNIELEALLYNRLALWYREKQQYQQALAHFGKSRDLFDKLKQMRWKVISQISIAEVYDEMGNDQQFEKNLLDAEQIAKKYEISDNLLSIYNYLKDYYQKKSNYQKTLEYTNKYYQLAITENERNSNDKLKLIELENNIKNKEQSLTELRIKQRNYFIISAITLVSLVIACFSIYLLIKNNRRKLSSIEKDKKIIEVELENKRLKEIILQEKDDLNQQYLSSFVKQSESIEDFLDNLSQRIKKNNSLSQEDINDMRLSFLKLSNQNLDIKNISNISKFNLQDLILKIKHQYNNITAADLNLITLLYEGVNSKDIASLLNISVSSVNTKRYRLRKKLNLGNDDSFDDFFKQIIEKN